MWRSRRCTSVSVVPRGLYAGVAELQCILICSSIPFAAEERHKHFHVCSYKGDAINLGASWVSEEPDDTVEAEESYVAAGSGDQVFEAAARVSEHRKKTPETSKSHTVLMRQSQFSGFETDSNYFHDIWPLVVKIRSEGLPLKESDISVLEDVRSVAIWFVKAMHRIDFVT